MACIDRSNASSCKGLSFERMRQNRSRMPSIVTIRFRHPFVNPSAQWTGGLQLSNSTEVKIAPAETAWNERDFDAESDDALAGEQPVRLGHSRLGSLRALGRASRCASPPWRRRA